MKKEELQSSVTCSFAVFLRWKKTEQVRQNRPESSGGLIQEKMSPVSWLEAVRLVSPSFSGDEEQGGAVVNQPGKPPHLFLLFYFNTNDLKVPLRDPDHGPRLDIMNYTK